MAARRREARRRNWPENLYINGQDYYYFRHPETKKTFGLGREFAVACEQVKVVNANLALKKPALSLLARVNSDDKTVAQWCDIYIVPLLKNVMSDGTLWTLKNEVETIKTSAIGGMPIASVEPKDIVPVIRAAEERGPSVARKVRFRLNSLFRAAINEGLIPAGSNPAETTYAPKKKVVRARLTFIQFTAIVKAAREKPGYGWAANAFELALVTAQRREDIAGMVFTQVKDGFIWVEQGKTKTKLKIPTSIFLPALQLSVEDVVRRCRDDVVSKYLVHLGERRGRGKAGSRISTGHLSNTFALFRDEAKIKTPTGKEPTSFHEIRSLAARMYAAEYGNEFAQAILGHKSSRMTDLYRDARGDEWSEVRRAS